MTGSRGSRGNKPRIETRWPGENGWRWERTRHVDRGFGPDWKEGDPPTAEIKRRASTWRLRGRPRKDHDALTLIAALVIAKRGAGPGTSERKLAAAVLEVLDADAMRGSADAYEKAVDRMRKAIRQIEMP